MVTAALTASALIVGTVLGSMIHRGTALGHHHAQHYCVRKGELVGRSHVLKAVATANHWTLRRAAEEYLFKGLGDAEMDPRIISIMVIDYRRNHPAYSHYAASNCLPNSAELHSRMAHPAGSDLSSRDHELAS